MSDHQLPPGQEIARIIKTADGLCIVLTPGVWDRASAWGIAIADLVRNVALMYAHDGADVDTQLRKIRAMLDAELNAPTSPLEPLPRTD